MKSRVIVFDLMRALAILIIVFHHLPGYTGNFYEFNVGQFYLDLTPLNELNRYLGLGVFIFLSGYLSNLKKTRFPDQGSAIRFLGKKFIRIFPLYYLALFAFIQIHRTFDPTTIIVHLLGLQLLLASPQIHPVRTLWFVGLIVVYYCLFAILNLLRLNPLHRVLIIVLFPVSLFLLNNWFQFTNIRLFIYYWIFLIGLFCAEISFFDSQFWQKNKVLVTSVFPLVLLFSFWVEQNYELDKIEFLYYCVLIVILEFTFVCFAYQLSSLISRYLQFLKPIELISYASYCIFLFHRPILFVINEVLKRRLGMNYSIAALILLFIGVPLVIVLSYYIQKFYDQILLKLEPLMKSIH